MAFSHECVGLHVYVKKPLVLICTKNLGRQKPRRKRHLCGRDRRGRIANGRPISRPPIRLLATKPECRSVLQLSVRAQQELQWFAAAIHPQEAGHGRRHRCPVDNDRKRIRSPTQKAAGTQDPASGVSRPAKPCGSSYWNPPRSIPFIQATPKKT